MNPLSLTKLIKDAIGVLTIATVSTVAFIKYVKHYEKKYGRK